MKRRNIPEVTQTSAMDCGPAVLASVLLGFGASVSYPRLREACQTDVDGTSIDTLEELANRFGFCAEQVVLPNDFILGGSGSNLPCIAVVQLPNGLTHFVAVWRELFGFVQIMDPARGRSWIRKDRFRDMLYQHRIVVPAEDWLAYAQSEEFRGYLAEGIRSLHIDAPAADSLIAQTYEAGGWRSIARLDAAVRMCRSMHARGLRRSVSPLTLLQALLDEPDLLADDYFQVAPEGEEDLVMKGAVLVRIAGGETAADPEDPVVAHTHQPEKKLILKEFLDMAGELGAGRVALGLVFVSFLVSAVTFIEAIVFRYLIGAPPPADMPMLLLTAFIVIAPLLAALALEAGGLRLSRTLGRYLSTSVHAKLLRKLPRMADGYFSSRLVSDLAERGHAISQVREIPELFRQILIIVGRIALVLAGLAWLLPGQWPLIGLAFTVSLIAPLAIYPTLVERDLRARTHLGALSRFYLDSLRGSEAIWAHGAAPSIRHEQESLLLGWVRAVTEQQRPSLVFEGIQVVVLAAIGIALVNLSLDTVVSLGTILLIAYWSLIVPVLSLQLTQNLRQMPSLSNVCRRVLELLDAPEEDLGQADGEADGEADHSPDVGERGVALQFNNATVRRGGSPLIHSVNVSIRPGERVAIVGASGSGKSSFLGTILGWNPLDTGELIVDGAPLTPEAAARLREETVMVDPDLYLWNRSLFDNVRYGLDDMSSADCELALSSSELLEDLKRMEEGLATRVGENGSRLSGGESQRLRVARGLARSSGRLVLLDEPFTGMDSEQRLRVRSAIENRWPGATMLFVSHNVAETDQFQRVLVFDQGRIVEDGPPEMLLATPGSLYGQMVEKEVALKNHLRQSDRWQHRHLQAGKVAEL